MSDPRPPRYLKSMNRVVKAMQRLGVHTGPAMILTVPGRKTGKPRSTPMTPFTYRGDMYTVAGYPGADWAANARAAGARHSVAWTQVTRNQDRRAQRRGVTAGTARVSGAGSSRRRLRQTLGARARRVPGRVRSARRTIGCLPVRPDELTRDVSGRSRHADVAGTGFHPYVQGFVTVGGTAGRLQVVAHLAGMCPQVQFRRRALLDADAGVAAAALHGHLARYRRG